MEPIKINGKWYDRIEEELESAIPCTGCIFIDNTKTCASIPLEKCESHIFIKHIEK